MFALSEIAAKAEENRSLFSGTAGDQTNTLGELIRAADLMFGVFTDLTKSEGVATTIIKGEGLLERILFVGLSEQVRWNAVSCRGPEEAEAMRKAFGDGRYVN